MARRAARRVPSRVGAAAIGLGEILKDLGVRSIRLLSSSQHTDVGDVGPGGFGAEITATEAAGGQARNAG
jgi:GTP cyclohydrolase II